jgi:DNA-binding MarR family transcriptional regulator
MKATILDSVTEDLFSIPPVIGASIRRKLLRAAFTHIDEDISPPHFIIMKTLAEADTLHVSEISQRLLIPKPQMTHLIDRLEDLGIVERQTDSQDRRAINITLTAKGREVLEKHDGLIKEAVKTTLSCLTEEELQQLLTSLHTLRDILLKLE